MEHKTEFKDCYFKLVEWFVGVSKAQLEINSVKKYIASNSCSILKIPAETETSKAAVSAFLENLDTGRKELTPNSYSENLRTCIHKDYLYVCDLPCDKCLVAMGEKLLRGWLEMNGVKPGND